MQSVLNDWKCDCTGYNIKCTTRAFVSQEGHNGRNVFCCGCDCFPSTARVSLEKGESVTMAELKIGDRVKTGSETYI